jgi:hypothetical protein
MSRLRPYSGNLVCAATPPSEISSWLLTSPYKASLHHRRLRPDKRAPRHHELRHLPHLRGLLPCAHPQARSGTAPDAPSPALEPRDVELHPARPPPEHPGRGRIDGGRAPSPSSPSSIHPSSSFGLAQPSSLLLVVSPLLPSPGAHIPRPHPVDDDKRRTPSTTRRSQPATHGSLLPLFPSPSKVTTTPHATPRPSLCRDPASGSRVICGSS